MDVSEKGTPAKKRLEKVSRYLLKINPLLFESIDKFFNIARYVDLRNLNALFKNQYERVLEIGCGKGYFSDFFAQRGGLYCGIDIEAEEIAFFKKCKEAKKTAGRYKLAMASGICLPFADNSFDLVFCNCVIEHIIDDDAVFKETSRVLRPGGEMIFTFPTSTYEPRFLKKKLFKHSWLRCLADPSLSHYFIFPTIQDAEDWYVRERWCHVRRGYAVDDVCNRLRSLGMEIDAHFYYFTQPLVEIWELCTFSRLNCLFPLSLLLFAPMMQMMNVTKHGDKKDSQLFAIKASRDNKAGGTY